VTIKEETVNDNTEQQQPLPDKEGKIGRLQLLKSGRVRLITTDGRSFEVNSGLSTCFLQTLLAVDYQPPPPPSSTSGSVHNTNSSNEREGRGTATQPTMMTTTSSSSAGVLNRHSNTTTTTASSSSSLSYFSGGVGRSIKVETGFSSQQQESSAGSLHFMGNITRKLVITPNYELGVKRNKSANQSRTAQRAREEGDEEEEQGMGENQRIEEMVDDFIMEVDS
jgi:hypothetical protein